MAATLLTPTHIAMCSSFCSPSEACRRPLVCGAGPRARACRTPGNVREFRVSPPATERITADVRPGL